MNQYPYGTSGYCPIDEPEIVSREEWAVWEPSVGTVWDDSGLTAGIGIYEVGWGEGFYDPDVNPDGYACYSDLIPNEPLAAILDTIVIHHEGNSETHSMRQVQKDHMSREGWTDIGYHFGVDLSGTIYEGRDIAVRGAHVQGGNTGAIGVLALGDFEPGLVIELPTGRNVRLPDRSDKPTPQLVHSIIKLVRWLDYQYGIDRVVGHQDLNPTFCPGKDLQAWVPVFNYVAQER